MKILLKVLTDSIQKKLIKEVKRIINLSPLIQPIMPKWNKPYKTLITNAGEWGWISDKLSYRYVGFHPKTKEKWPKIPNLFYQIWKEFSDYEKLPDCSLINVFPDQNSKLGLHKDKDEKCFKAPVLSISLGNTAVFKYGKTKQTLKQTMLPSGSIVVLKDYSRLYYHSISKILVEKDLLKKKNPVSLPQFPNGRISITLRKFS